MSAPVKSTSLTLVPDKDTVLSVSVKNTAEPFCPPKIKYLTIMVVGRPAPLTVTVSDPDNDICEGDLVRFTADEPGYDRYRFYDNSRLLGEKSFNTWETKDWKDGHGLTALAVNGECPGKMSDPVILTVHGKLKHPRSIAGHRPTVQ